MALRDVTIGAVRYLYTPSILRSGNYTTPRTIPHHFRYKAIMTENRKYRMQQYAVRADVDAEGLLKVPTPNGTVLLFTATFRRGKAFWQPVPPTSIRVQKRHIPSSAAREFIDRQRRPQIPATPNPRLCVPHICSLCVSQLERAFATSVIRPVSNRSAVTTS